MQTKFVLLDPVMSRDINHSEDLRLASLLLADVALVVRVVVVDAAP